MRIRPHLRTTALVVLGALVIGDSGPHAATPRRTASAAAERPARRAPPPRGVGRAGTGEPSIGRLAPRVPGCRLPRRPGGDRTSTTSPRCRPDALLAAIDALPTELRDHEAVELTVHFPVGSGPYASLSYQLPDRPTGRPTGLALRRVGEASPVKLTGSDDVAAGGTSARSTGARLPPFPGRRACRGRRSVDRSRIDRRHHLIAADGAPFFDGTVIRVYVDGGTAAPAATSPCVPTEAWLGWCLSRGASRTWTISTIAW